MILKVNTKLTGYITGAQDLESKYDGRKWLDDNIHLYDGLSHEPAGDATDKIIADFFADYKGITSIKRVSEKVWEVVVFEIPFWVVTGKKCIPVNTREKAEALFCSMAKKRLLHEDIYKKYPQDKIDYSVYESMCRSLNINLKIIG